MLSFKRVWQDFLRGYTICIPISNEWDFLSYILTSKRYCQFWYLAILIDGESHQCFYLLFLNGQSISFSNNSPSWVTYTISHLCILFGKVSSHIALFILIWRVCFLIIDFPSYFNILHANLSSDMCFGNILS